MPGLISHLRPSSSRISKKLRSKINFRIELNFKALSQAMYKDGQNNNRIERFYSTSWEKEVLAIIDEKLPLKLKAFINTSNLRQLGQARLVIAVDDLPVSEKIFFIGNTEEHSGWLELSYNN
jgi:hypothetical protein